LIDKEREATSLHAGQTNIFRYTVALIAVALATVIGLLAWHYGFRHQYLFFLFGIALTAWYGGVGPAMVAFVSLGLIYNYLFREPFYSFRIVREDVPDYFLFVVFGLMVAWFGAVRRRAEETLAERASLLDLTHDTVFVRNMNDVITYWNRGAEELYGWSREEAVGQVSQQLTRPIFPEALDEINAKLLRAGRWEGEMVHATRDGAQVVVASRWSLQRDERGNPSAILETNNDVTERKKAEEALRRSHDELEKKVRERTTELRQANDDLQSVNKELEAFAYSVSHDLRAPIRHIAGFTELLQKHADPVLDDKSRRHVRMVLDSANRMGSLVDDLLAFSRISRAETQKTTINLEQLVKGVVGEIVPDTEGRNIFWRIGKLPICYGDPSMFRLVFANLVSNAVKFTRTREQAEIEIGPLDHPDEVVVFVKDNGVGFDMKYKDKLFGVFQRLHSQETFEGTGIGLATVQRIVHRHGGRVWAEGSVNGGATFYIALPKL
jgi:PAS domain S-box-containing protein